MIRTAPSPLPVWIMPSRNPNGAERASTSLERSAELGDGVLAVANATTETRTSELSGGGGQY